MDFGRSAKITFNKQLVKFAKQIMYLAVFLVVPTVFALEDLEDPMRPPQYQATRETNVVADISVAPVTMPEVESQTDTMLSVSAIFGDHTALINGRLLHKGGQIGEATVVDILPQGAVYLSRRGTHFFIYLLSHKIKNSTKLTDENAN